MWSVRLALTSALLVAGCSSGSGAPSAADAGFLAQVHGGSADISSLRSDTALVRLGHAVCDAFGAGASYQQVADRLNVEQGAHPLPAADLGAVITAAADNYCPRYKGRV